MLSIVHVHSPPQMFTQCTENVYSMCTFHHLQRIITSGFPHSHVTPTRDTHRDMDTWRIHRMYVTVRNYVVYPVVTD